MSPPFAYVHKDPAATPTPPADGWPPFWPLLEGPPFPPGWPIEIDGEYSLEVVIPSALPVGDEFSVSVRVLDDQSDPADIFDSYVVKTTATVGGVAVQLKLFGDDDFADQVFTQISSLGGGEHGFDEDFEIDTSVDDNGLPVVLTSTMVNVIADPTITGSDTGTVTVADDLALAVSIEETVAVGGTCGVSLTVAGVNPVVLNGQAVTVTAVLDGSPVTLRKAGVGGYTNSISYSIGSMGGGVYGFNGSVEFNTADADSEKQVILQAEVAADADINGQSDPAYVLVDMEQLADFEPGSSGYLTRAAFYDGKFYCIQNASGSYYFVVIDAENQSVLHSESITSGTYDIVANESFVILLRISGTSSVVTKKNRTTFATISSATIASFNQTSTPFDRMISVVANSTYLYARHSSGTSIKRVLLSDLTMQSFTMSPAIDYLTYCDENYVYCTKSDYSIFYKLNATTLAVVSSSTKQVGVNNPGQIVGLVRDMIFGYAYDFPADTLFVETGNWVFSYLDPGEDFQWLDAEGPFIFGYKRVSQSEKYILRLDPLTGDTLDTVLFTLNGSHDDFTYKKMNRKERKIFMLLGGVSGSQTPYLYTMKI